MPTTRRAVDAARLRLAVMRLARRLRQEAHLDLTPSQLSAMATLDRSGPMTLGDLAAAEQVGPSTLTRVVAALEDRGLLERTADPNDRRCAVMHVTPAGHQLLTAARNRAARLLHDRLAGLSDEQLQALAAALPVLEQLVEDAT